MKIRRHRIKEAEELLATAHKVDRYRCDLIEASALELMRSTANELAAQLREGRKKTDAIRFEKNFTQLESLLREHGGSFYPKSFLAENVEVLLVAAIIVLGIRAFFFQPFIIPTNSMYPSYSGMRGYTYTAENPSPSQLERSFRLITRGARHRSITAPVSGTVELPAFSHASNSPDRALSGRGFFRFREVAGRKWFLLPTTLREYTLLVNGRPTTFRVPLDFNADDVILKTFFPDVDDLRSFVGGLVHQGVLNLGERDPRIPVPGRVAAGDPILQFDIELGDALFVDRFTYHFRAPRIGDPIVFRTREIEGMRAPGGGINDQYYIKRLAGIGGETLSIKGYALLADGELRDEVHAFNANAAREGEFPGFRNVGLLDEGKHYRVPEGFMFALGDNSADSSDSRYWGPLPENAVIGRALFVYYPFTRRWGVAD